MFLFLLVKAISVSISLNPQGSLYSIARPYNMETGSASSTADFMTSDSVTTHSDHSSAHAKHPECSSFGNDGQSSSAMHTKQVLSQIEPVQQSTLCGNQSFLAGTTQDEQSGHPRKPWKEVLQDERLERLKRAALNRMTRPAKRLAAINACVNAGTLPEDAAAKLRKETEGDWESKLKRKDQIRVKKRDARVKAVLQGRVKILERIIRDLVMNQVGKQLGRKMAVGTPRSRYSLRNTISILMGQVRSLKAFFGSQRGDQRMLRLLQRHEDILKSMAYQAGFVEAPFPHQNNPNAPNKEMQKQCGERPAVDKSSTESFDDDTTASLESSPEPPMATKAIDGTISPTSPPAEQHQLQTHLTDRQIFQDIQTAKDVATYQRNPQETFLPKNRWKRVRNALSCGRTDLNAMELERQHTKAE